MRKPQVGKKFRAEITVVTPAMAKKWLSENEENFRLPNNTRVHIYAAEMTAGAWKLNGESIKFDNDGKLRDGQHRLLAIVMSGVTIQTLVCYGLEEDYGVDRGMNRTVAQTLANQGLKNSAKIAAIAKLALIHEKGKWAAKHGSGLTHDSEVIAFALENYEDLDKALKLSKICERNTPPSTIGAVMYIGSVKGGDTNCDVGRWFCQALKTGSELSDQDPVLHLRNRLLASASARAQLTTTFKRYYCTMAWNFTVQGRQCRSHALSVRLVGPTKTKPPERIFTVDEFS